MEDDPLKPWFGNDEEDDDELNGEAQEELLASIRNHYEFGHLVDPTEIACFAEEGEYFNKQSFIAKLSCLNEVEFDFFCIKLIQRQAFHDSIMGCAGTENEEYIPDHLKKDFVLKKRFEKEIPQLEESIHNRTAAGILAQKSKKSGTYCKNDFIEAIKNMSDTEFQKMCGDIKFFCWQDSALSDEWYTNNPFAIPPRLRSHFWINGIDDEHFFVYEQFPQHPDKVFMRKNSDTPGDFIVAIKQMSQDDFNSLCKNVIQSHYFVYKVSGMVGTDLPERIPGELKEHFSNMDLAENEIPLLEPGHTGGFDLNTRPGFVFQDCFDEDADQYSKRQLINKIGCMSKEEFEKFSYQTGLVIYLRFSHKDDLFTYAYHSIPKDLRMYFRYFDIWERVFTQRLDEYFGDIEPHGPQWF